MEKEEKKLNTKFIIMGIICICLFVICASLLAVVIKNRSNIKLFGPDKKSSNTVEDVPAVTADSSDYVVCLDPGHGGRFTGTQGLDGTYEKDDTLKIALEVKKALENRGVKVVMTRTDDSDIELDEEIQDSHEIISSATSSLQSLLLLVITCAKDSAHDTQDDTNDCCNHRD